jgi:hypothetical protein
MKFWKTTRWYLLKAGFAELLSVIFYRTIRQQRRVNQDGVVLYFQNRITKKTRTAFYSGRQQRMAPRYNVWPIIARQLFTWNPKELEL